MSPSAPRQPLVPPRRREQQLAPGVYFTPGAQTSPSAPAAPEHHGLSEMRAELAALRKSVQMLQESNDEMRAYDFADPELVQAVSENLAIILRRNAAAAHLETRIVELEGGRAVVEPRGAHILPTEGVEVHTRETVGECQLPQDTDVKDAPTPSSHGNTVAPEDQGMYL